MGASQATSTAAAAATATLPLQPCSGICAPCASGKAESSKACVVLPPANAAETVISVSKKGQGKLAVRRWRPLGRPGQMRLHAKKLKQYRPRQRLVRRQQLFACPRKPCAVVAEQPKPRFRPAHRIEASCASSPIRGILRKPDAARAAAASRKASWWVPRVLKRSAGKRLTFDSTVCATEFSRSLGDGVPSEGDIAIGLGRPIATTHMPLAKVHRKWNKGEELPIVQAECRADVIKEWMGASRFEKVVEDHMRETALIRQRRKDSMAEGKDVTMMPTSLEEARARALKVAQEAAEATMEYTSPRLVLSGSPQKRKFEETKKSRPLKVALFQEVAPPPRKRRIKSQCS